MQAPSVQRITGAWRKLKVSHDLHSSGQSSAKRPSKVGTRLLIFEHTAHVKQPCSSWPLGPRMDGYPVATPCAWRSTWAYIVLSKNWPMGAKSAVKKNSAILVCISSPLSLCYATNSRKTSSCVSTHLAMPLLVRSSVRSPSFFSFLVAANLTCMA